MYPVRFVLVESSHPGNVGAAARAMKTMGFDDLVLVNPQCDIDSEARARSSGALDVLQKATTVQSLAEAVAGCGMVVGASARRRRVSWPELNPRECAAAVTGARADKPAAVVFGPERAGLRNADMDLCHALVYIPANPDYNSLNLAAALQIIAYELRTCELDGRTDGDASPADNGQPLASADQMQQFFEHLEQALIESGFLHPDNPRHLMRRVRRLFNRARLDEREVNIMRGIIKALSSDNPHRPGS